MSKWEGFLIVIVLVLGLAVALLAVGVTTDMHQMMEGMRVVESIKTEIGKGNTVIFEPAGFGKINTRIVEDDEES
jgi:hypothetical protein